MDQQPQPRERFFFFYVLALFLVVAIGFPLHAWVNPERVAYLRPMYHLHIHALSMGSWYALMVAQVSLAAAGRMGLHRALGVGSLLLVPVMLGTGLYVSSLNFERTGDFLLIRANTVSVVAFCVLYGAALLKRARPAAHKRLMVVAALALMSPVFARWCYIFGWDNMFALPMWAAFLIAVLLRDLLVERSAVPWSALGVAAMVVHVAAIFAWVSLG